jgi:hypothetical protein
VFITVSDDGELCLLTVSDDGELCLLQSLMMESCVYYSL